MNLAILKLMVFPAMGILWRFFAPLLSGVLPLNKEVVHVSSMDNLIATATQYPIISFPGIVRSHGYTAEEFNVTTDDGYVLTLHRISGSTTKPKAFGKPVVFVQHGIGLSSDSYVIIGPDTDLVYILVDHGFDVWLGNVRGNTYSRKHLFKDPKNADFWKFSYHEMAIYDARQSIDHILEHTGQTSLTYFGYSMGTTISYALLSEYPEYNKKINFLVSAAPVVFWKHDLRPLMKIVNAIFDPLQQFIEYFDFNELIPQTALTAYIGENFCGNDDAITQNLCAYILSNNGLDYSRMNKTALPAILAHYPAGTSAINVYHYNQNFKRNTFEAYDYGASENTRRYGTATPPAYDLSRVTVPVSIWYGKDDTIVNVEDVFELAKRLPNVVSLTAVGSDKFNHFDFLWAQDVRQCFYDRVVQEIEARTFR